MTITQTSTNSLPPTLGVHYDFAEPDRVPLVGAALRLLGAHRGRSGVWVDDDVLDITFGPWRLTTPLDNIARADVDGPYSGWRALGPRLSLADRGLTFGTTTTAGACITFRDPVPGIEPTGLLLHPSVTVTVDQPHLLVQHLRRHLDGRNA